MEIVAEITTDEYIQVIKDYYLNKDWTKLIAILALTALVLALVTISGYGPYKWRYLYGFFDAYFFLLFLFFFVLPYGICYIRMRQAVKSIAHRPENWLFNFTETGIYTTNDEIVESYPWATIEKVYKLGDYIVFKLTSGKIFCLPMVALNNEAAEPFLTMINQYRHNLGNWKK